MLLVLHTSIIKMTEQPDREQSAFAVEGTGIPTLASALALTIEFDHYLGSHFLTR